MKNNEGKRNRFIEILEIIYAIIFACAIAKMLDMFPEPKDFFSITLKIWSCIFISVFVLIRFFFAPSKNVKILVDRIEKHRRLIMFFDVPALLAHSFIFYLMCLSVKNEEIFYRWFFYLLFGNAIWLGSIWLRLYKDPEISYIKKWSINNIVFFGAFTITFYVFGVYSWVLWFFLAFFNSTIDIYITYKDYLSAD